MLTMVERICHHPAKVYPAQRRTADQALYISDCSAFSDDTGWLPRRSVEQTVRDVVASWYATNIGLTYHSAAPDIGILKEAA
jgi:UDP-glucose 4-epimerase